MKHEQLDLAIHAAKAAGGLLTAAYRRSVSVLNADGKDIKTAEDHAAEACILDLLSRESGLPVLTEETGLHAGAVMNQSDCWVVDPLDGTLNYARGLPLCCVSIALWRGREPVLGVVYEFLYDRLFAGLVGEGAWCNGSSIAVSEVRLPAQAVIATGFPAGGDFSDGALLGFVHQVQQFKKVRLLGTAALSLAQVATGAADVYAENGICFWDVAAGLALVRAAGGDFTATAPTVQWRQDVFASNGRLAMP